MSRATTSTDETTHGTPPSTWWDTAALGLLALLVAGPGLGSPAAFVFDEIYYVSDAYSHLEVGVGRGFQAHPPLGTWLIAAGITIVDSPIGWRLASLALGVATVMSVHRLAIDLLPRGVRGRLLAAAAAVLLVSDGSWFVLSRTAMLDGPVTAFITVAVALINRAASGPRMGWRQVTLAGAAVGAAIAIKWSGALALPLVALVLAIHRNESRLLTRARCTVVPLLVLTGVATVVYTVSWVPFAMQRSDVSFVDCPNVAVPCVEAGDISGVLAQHEMLVRYHTRIQSDAEIASPPSLWPLLRDPIGFYRPDCHIQTEPVAAPTMYEPPDTCDDDLEVGEDTIIYGGNIVIWFGFVALLPILASAARRRDQLAQIALAGWALQWLPWLLATRTSYLWYAAPTVPFLVLGLMAAARALPTTAISRTYVHAAGGASLGLLVTTLTAAPEAAALLGWGIGAWIASRSSRPLPKQIAPASIAVGGVLTGVAAVAAIIANSSWTAG